MRNLVQNQYVFVLGREQEIALEELKAVLNRFSFVFDVISVSGNAAVINIEKEGDCDVARLIDILGGTIKIFKIASSVIPTSTSVIPAKAGILYNSRSRIKSGMTENKSKDKQVETITDIISDRCKSITGKLNFGISDYTGKIDRQKINSIGLEVKKEFKNRGLHPRFVALREGNELSSITSLKNKLDRDGVEIGIFCYGSNEVRTSHFGSKDIAFGVLIALNNPEEWSKRDYGKPAGDKRSGMMPPKLARMLVNISLGMRSTIFNSQFSISNQTSNLNSQCLKISDIKNSLKIKNCKIENCLMIDPFCGSGNILMEAMMLGCDVIGSDISEKAVGDTRLNINWLLEQIRNPKSEIRNKSQIQIPNVKIFRSDATELDPSALFENCKLRIENYDCLAIVTEPYLGEPKKFAPSMNSVQGEYSKVKKTYLEFLENIVQLLNCSIVKSQNHQQFSNLAIEQLNLCLVFPLVETQEGKRFSLYRECVDEIKKLGYTELRMPLLYGRDYQIVKREIVFLRFQVPNNKSQINSNNQ